MFTVTVRIADFVTTGPAPVNAFVAVSRATPDVATDTIVSTEPHRVYLTAGVGTFQAEPNTAYRVQIVGVDGLEADWYFTHNADTSLAALYRLHQIDPGTLAPLPIPVTLEERLADLQQQIDDIPTGGGGGGTSIVDNGDGTLTSTSSSIVDNGDGTLTAA